MIFVDLTITFPSFLRLLNDCLPIFVTFLPIVASVIFLLPLNALSPISVILSGITIFLNAVHFSNALYPIFVTHPGIVNILIDLQPLYVVESIFVSYGCRRHLASDYRPTVSLHAGMFTTMVRSPFTLLPFFTVTVFII